MMCPDLIDVKDVEDLSQTFPDLEQRLQVYTLWYHVIYNRHLALPAYILHFMSGFMPLFCV